MAKIVNTANFRGTVEESNNVVVVDFFATWCGPCKMLAPVFDSLSEELTDVDFVKVDIDQSLELAQKFGITTVPTMMIFKDGKVVDTLVGFMPKDNLKAKVQAHL
ncbi:MAG: thioredoxin [Peptostreptococcaceae bacterium]|jgi:thioredoxin 1|nr:thioredoxin [Peptostreptococcaceae bacterium]